jgi:hypothetical protein
MPTRNDAVRHASESTDDGDAADDTVVSLATLIDDDALIDLIVAVAAHQGFDGRNCADRHLVQWLAAWRRHLD